MTEFQCPHPYFKSLVASNQLNYCLQLFKCKLGRSHGSLRSRACTLWTAAGNRRIRSTVASCTFGVRVNPLDEELTEEAADSYHLIYCHNVRLILHLFLYHTCQKSDLIL